MSRRALIIAACFATAAAGTQALAQGAWPSSPQAQQQAPASAWPAPQQQQAPAGAWPAPGASQSAPSGAWPAPQASQAPASQGPSQPAFVPPSAGFGAPMGAARQQEPPCFKEFTQLSQDAAKKRSAIEQAGKKKVGPAVACRLFNDYAASEAKLIKYVSANTAACGMPKDLLDNLNKGHAQTTQIRTRVCEVAAAPPKPAGPSLSDALSAPVPDSSNVKRGHGTFDTLSGSPLKR